VQRENRIKELNTKQVKRQDLKDFDEVGLKVGFISGLTVVCKSNSSEVYKSHVSEFFQSVRFYEKAIEVLTHNKKAKMNALK